MTDCKHSATPAFNMLHANAWVPVVGYILEKYSSKCKQTLVYLLWGMAARMRLAPTSDIAVLEREREMREVLRSRAGGGTNVNTSIKAFEMEWYD